MYEQCCRKAGVSKRDSMAQQDVRRMLTSPCDRYSSDSQARIPCALLLRTSVMLKRTCTSPVTCQQDDWSPITEGLVGSWLGASHTGSNLVVPSRRHLLQCFPSRLWGSLSTNPALPHSSWVALSSLQKHFICGKVRRIIATYLLGVL